MIISPYNLQVNLLSKRISRCETGTIDTFQGREAPVTIISMTACDITEVPRGLNFLLNTNRLNVALSRAKALVIIVASPALLRTRCAHVIFNHVLYAFLHPPRPTQTTHKEGERGNSGNRRAINAADIPIYFAQKYERIRRPNNQTSSDFSGDVSHFPRHN
jgi:hypothetical protein